MSNFFPLVGQVDFDFIDLHYDGSGNLDVVTYKKGGSTGNVVEVLHLTYDGSGNLLTVTRTVL